MVLLIMKDRCCFESDMEAIRICSEWKTPFHLIRTKFDIDLSSYIRDKPEKIKELAEKEECGLPRVAQSLRLEIQEELTKSLLAKGSNLIKAHSPLAHTIRDQI